MSGRDEFMHGEPQSAVHRDYLPLAMPLMQELAPAPWHRLSKADCLLLAVALHRCARAAREAAFPSSAPEFSPDESHRR